MAEQEQQREVVRTAGEMVEAIEKGLTPRYDHLDRNLSDMSIFTEAHLRLREKVLIALQEHLDSIKGTPLSGEADMKHFASNLRALLDSLGNLRVAVPSGRHEGKSGRLIVVPSGPAKEPRFAIRTQTTQSILHAQGQRIPHLRVTQT